MKVRRFNSIAGTVVLLVAVVGCVRLHELRPVGRNPAAVGTIGANVDANKNTLLDVRLEHLAPPPALDPALSTYVVWIRPIAADEFINIGQLAMQADRSGRLRATTPHPEFDVLVTAEPSGTVRDPGTFIVLEGHAKRP